MSPNEALIGYQVKLLPDLIIQSQNPTVEEQVESIKERRDQAIQALNQAVNASPLPHARYNLRDQVWLEGTYLKAQYQSSKLAPKRYGPFQIVKVISPVAYQLQYVSQPHGRYTTCSMHHSYPPIAKQLHMDQTSSDHHRHHGRSRMLQYLIKWKGYPHSDNTWEPASQVHAPELTKVYHRKHLNSRDKNPLDKGEEIIQYLPLLDTGSPSRKKGPLLTLQKR
jgi:hypothetical protein